VVKQRLQTCQFKSAPDVVRLIVAKEGFKGLYVVCIFWYSYLGNNLLICNINFYLKRSFDAIQFCIYEQLRIGYNVLVRLVFPSLTSVKEVKLLMNNLFKA
jgi:solute carrier family 25 S-adenosylmethionine transporter 26